jgi:hypothetical protein
MAIHRAAMAAGMQYCLHLSGARLHSRSFLNDAFVA